MLAFHWEKLFHLKNTWHIYDIFESTFVSFQINIFFKNVSAHPVFPQHFNLLIQLSKYSKNQSTFYVSHPQVKKQFTKICYKAYLTIMVAPLLFLMFLFLKIRSICSTQYMLAFSLFWSITFTDSNSFKKRIANIPCQFILFFDSISTD